MKRALCSFLMACTVGFTVEAAQLPKLVNVAVEKAYVPIGFDDNDRVQVTVTGILPDPCYKISESFAQVNESRKVVQVWQTAYRYPGVCPPVIVPFTQVVNVGLVRSGEYELRDAISGRRLGKLPVSRSTHPEPDDYLYAPIDDAFIITDASGTKTLTLLGEFADRCTEFQEVKVLYHPEVIVVQPIARRIGGGRCKPEKWRFVKTVELESSLKGVHLLHVRSMNGQAINKLVDVAFVEQ